LRTLALKSRFDLAYNTDDNISLAALRWHGYARKTTTLSSSASSIQIEVGTEVWRVLSHCHNLKIRGKYEEYLDINNRLVVDLINATEVVRAMFRS